MKFPNKLFSGLLFSGLLFFTMVLVNVSRADAAGFREYENPPCYDITGQTQPVLVAPGNINNGGIMNFDDFGVAAQYQACVRVDKFGADAQPVRLEGWVWNDNLGWVSLYCPGGAGAMNLDIPCGIQPYEIKFTTSGPDGLGNFASVLMSGYAWGDNTGWITFNTAALHQLKPVSSAASRGLISASSPASDRHAWADAIGWFDFSGVWFHWEDTDPPIPDPNVKKYVSICSTLDTLPIPVSPPDAGVSYSSGGNIPTSMSIYGNDLWVVNMGSKNLTKFNISTGTPVVASTFTSTDANEKAPYFVDSESSGVRTYMISYSPGSDFGVVAFNEATGAKIWSKKIDWSMSSGLLKFHDMYADGVNGVVWVLASDASSAHLMKFQGSSGTLLADLTFPAGVSVNQVTYTPWAMWVLQSDNKLIKVSFAGAYYAGSYAASLVNPGISTSAVGANDLYYDNVNFALWVGLNSSNQFVKLKAWDGLPITGNLATSTYTAPVSGLSHFYFDVSQKAVWSVGSTLSTGKTASTTGLNLGLYPDLANTSPADVVSDNVNNVIWTTESVAPGRIWKTGRDTVTGFSVADAKCSCDVDGTCPIITDDAKVPVASGNTAYNVEVKFVDNATKIPDTDLEECSGGSLNMYTKAPGTSKYCAKMKFVWEDDVDYDQTTYESQKQSASQYSASNSGAVQKPLIFNLFGASDFKYNPVDTLWEAVIKSYAPSSDRNTTSGTQNEKFYYYDDGDLGSYNPDLIDQNLMKVREIDLLFFQYSTGPGIPGKCLYGNISEDRCEINNIVSTPSTISFNPAVRTDKLVYKSFGKELNYIALDSVDAIQNFVMTNSFLNPAFEPAFNMLFNIGLTYTSAYELKLLSGGAADFPQPDMTDITKVVNQLNVNTIGTFNWVGQIFVTDTAAVISQVKPYLYSKVEYKAAGASAPTVYWGAKLPRIKAGVLVNPVAKVQGNVYMTDFQAKSTDTPLKSLGNVSSNLKREQVVRNVAKYLSGFPVISIVTGNKTVNTGTVASITTLSELVTDKVFYLKDGNLTIDCGAAAPPAVSTCTFDKNVTFIVENGNIFVNSNILTTGNAQVGLIALRDLNGNKQTQGFLYLDKNVTWLSGVQIYLDRVMQGYDKSIAFVTDANGFFRHTPGPIDDYARQQTFGSQLVMEGTLSSMNGIGNASRTPATDENGNVLALGTYCNDYGSALLSDICRARAVDLNYLRYYGPGLEICSNGTPKDQKRAAEADLGCDASVPDYDIDAEGLYDAALTQEYDLVAGKLSPNAVRSQYFITKGLPVTLANEYPVNFFYKAISKDLAGFEVEQDLSPVVR